MIILLRYLGFTLLALLIAGALAITIVPRFLDRIYYQGPASDHFDGERFFNPDGEDTVRPPTGGSRGGFFWRFLTGSDGRPEWPERVAVAHHPASPTTQACRHLEREPGNVEAGIACDVIAGRSGLMYATWVGHATVLVQVYGLNILTDPIWSERASPFSFVGPKRVARPGIDFDDLPTIDLVLLSHNHYDHMDLPTLRRLWERDQPLIVTSPGNATILRSEGIGAVAADWGQTVTMQRPGALSVDPHPLRELKVTVTRNHHWGSRWFADRNRALWSSFVVHLPGGNLFFAGDTGFGDGRWPAEASAYGPIRLALIPIGAFRFTPGQMGTGSHIGPVGAAEVHRRLGASTSLPIHWGTFRLSYEAYDTAPRLLAEVMRCTGQTGFAPVAIGRPVEVPAYRPPQPSRKITGEQLETCLDTPAVRALR